MSKNTPSFFASKLSLAPSFFLLNPSALCKLRSILLGAGRAAARSMSHLLRPMRTWHFLLGWFGSLAVSSLRICTPPPPMCPLSNLPSTDHPSPPLNPHVSLLRSEWSPNPLPSCNPQEACSLRLPIPGWATGRPTGGRPLPAHRSARSHCAFEITCLQDQSLWEISLSYQSAPTGRQLCTVIAATLRTWSPASLQSERQRE